MPFSDLGDDTKVFGVTVLGLIFSYIKLNPLDSFRYVVLAVTLGYTIHKWWRINKNK